LSTPKSDGDRLHSITARKYFAVPSTYIHFSHKFVFQYVLITKRPYITYLTPQPAFIPLVCYPAGGTFATWEFQTVNPPKSQKYNSFMVTKGSPIQRAVYARSVF
jgi:hypothetical protein